MMTYKENVKAILECFFTGFKEEIIDSACDRILDIQQKPPKTAHWIEHNPKDGLSWVGPMYECSRCHCYAASESNFCPRCGSKMTEQESEDNQ